MPDIVRLELRSELRSALHRVFSAGEATITLPVNVAFGGQRNRIFMYIAPAKQEAEQAPQALVVFLDSGPARSTDSDDDEETSLRAPDIRRIHEELRTAQEQLSSSRREHQSSIQELRIANEELQSVNEEYRSTAEELETSKEELQSINEELQTVYAELKSKLSKIASAHGDLQNLINATEIGTLFLDRNLRIRMLTPSVELFSVSDSDIGRSITDFTHRLTYDGVEEDARKVLDTVPHRKRTSDHGRPLAADAASALSHDG